MKKLIPALVMLLVSAVVLSTASYAWFSTTDRVTAEGMKVTATAPASILIRGEAVDGNWTQFSNVLNFSDLYAADAMKLAPSSSDDGVNFFAPKAAYDVAGAMDFETEIGAATSAYHDFNLELKNDSVDQKVGVGVDSIKNMINSNMKGVVRVAVIVGTASNTASTDDLTANEDNTYVYLIDDYTPDWVKIPSKDAQGNIVYSDTNKAVGPLGAAWTKTSETAWATAAAGTDFDATSNPVYDTKGVSLITLEPQQYVRVTVRVWFEGQDAACISANAGANAEIDIAFKIITKETVTTVAPAEPTPGEGA